MLACRNRPGCGISLLLCLAMLFVFGHVPQAAADQIDITYEFTAPTIEKIVLDGQQYSEATMIDCPPSGPAGSPALPTKRARVLLPDGQAVEQISLVRSEKLLVASNITLAPVELPVPLSEFSKPLPALYVDQEAYTSGQPTPIQACKLVSEQVFRGYRIALIDIVPVEYVPSTGELYYFPQVSLTIETNPVASSSGVRALAEDAEAVRLKIDNVGALDSYVPALKSGRDAYDLLIITSSGLATAFQPLKDYHDNHGVTTAIHTLDDIGASDPHSIRDYIRQEYLANGVRLVLLGGDDDIIPALDLYVDCTLSDGSVVAYDMPGDFYFSCLDGTFNYDGDGRWGEPGDGEGGGEIDLLPEVGLGRVPAGNSVEVGNLINKTITYLESTDPYLSKIQLAGENLGFGGFGEYGGYAIDEMVNGSDAHGFTTYGFPEDQYDFDKLYDLTSMPNNHWSPAQLISRINAGVHIVDHLGHSDIGYAMRTDTTMVRTQLTNTDYCFLYAEGCNAGHFDTYDCWAEYVTTKLATGAFGCVANARIGLGSRSTQHPVHVINREFWDAVYSADEGYPELGMAISDARFDLASRIGEPWIRWTYYETNLFADPAVRIQPVRSLAIMFPDGCPEIVEPLTETSFDVTVTGIGDGVSVSGSGLVHCRVDGGDSTAVPLLFLRQEQYQVVLPPMQCGQTLEYYVSFEEAEGGHCYRPDPIEPVLAKVVSEEEVIFADSFESSSGWTLSGLWSIGTPTGQGGQELNYPVPDPTEGCSGTGVLGYNLAGDYENSLPARHATSPVIDCSGHSEIRLRYCRWLGVEQPVYDKATLSISTNGSDWTTLWQNPSIIVDLEWLEIEYDISAIAANQPTVYLRWTMGPTDSGLRYCGWNVDDVRVVSLLCESYTCGDADGNQIVNISDAVYLISYIFGGGPAPEPLLAGDADCNQIVNISDAVYLISYIFAGGPAPCENCS